MEKTPETAEGRESIVPRNQNLSMVKDMAIAVISYGNNGREFKSDFILLEHDIEFDQRCCHIDLQLL